MEQKKNGNGNGDLPLPAAPAGWNPKEFMTEGRKIGWFLLAVYLLVKIIGMAQIEQQNSYDLAQKAENTRRLMNQNEAESLRQKEQAFIEQPAQ